MHSGRIELAKLILVGTRITYQATGDAGCSTKKVAVDIIVVSPSKPIPGSMYPASPVAW